MPNKRNLTSVASLTSKLAKAKAIVFADYCGLSVNNQRLLRRQITAVGGELIVAKNTLLKIVFKDLKYPLESLIDTFTGPTVVLFAYEDEIAPIKALAEFSQAHELPIVKAGFLTKEPLTKAQVEILAKLPTRLELIAKTIGSLKSPISGIVQVLVGNIKKLVYTLSAVAKAKADKGGEI